MSQIEEIGHQAMCPDDPLTQSGEIIVGFHDALYMEKCLQNVVNTFFNVLLYITN